MKDRHASVATLAGQQGLQTSSSTNARIYPASSPPDPTQSLSGQSDCCAWRCFDALLDDRAELIPQARKSNNRKPMLE